MEVTLYSYTYVYQVDNWKVCRRRPLLKDYGGKLGSSSSNTNIPHSAPETSFLLVVIPT